MRSLVLGVMILVSFGLVDGQTSIRGVDFKNFTYPLSGPKFGHDRLRWLDVSKKGQIHLVNGKYGSGSPGFTLESVKFADVTGDGQEDAVVVVHFNTGGSQSTDYVYLYSFVGGEPKLLAYFHSGDRAYSGLHKVYGENGKLVVELYDPEKRLGDCCSSGLVRTRYKWRNGRFEAFGASEFGTLQEP